MQASSLALADNRMDKPIFKKCVSKALMPYFPVSIRKIFQSLLGLSNYLLTRS